MTNAGIRFFCVVGPRPMGRARGEVEGKLAWADVSFDYLTALVRADVPVRAISIGASFVRHRDDLMRGQQWSHWNEVQDIFARNMGTLRVNVVCSSFDLMMGTQLSRRAVAPPPVPGASKRLDFGIASEIQPDELVYVPSTALSSLWTAGIPNVALVELGPDETLSEIEREALEHYEHILTPRSAESLWVAGFARARVVPAEHFPLYVTCLV